MLGDALNDNVSPDLQPYYDEDGKVDCEKVKNDFPIWGMAPQQLRDDCRELADLLWSIVKDEGGGEANHTRPPMWDAVAGSKDPMEGVGPDLLKQVIDVRVRPDSIESTERHVDKHLPGT